MAWRALHGPEQEVIFRQTHEPGRLELSDFTDAGSPASPSPASRSIIASSDSSSPASSTLTSCSAAKASRPWPRACRTPFGRSATRRRASQREPVGRVPQLHGRRAGRHHRALRGADGPLRHDGNRNNTGVVHENGSAESAHGHLKRALEDALLLRGSPDFPDLDACRAFLDALVGRRNANLAKPIALEKAALAPLPRSRTTDFQEKVIPVTSSTTASFARPRYACWSICGASVCRAATPTSMRSSVLATSTSCGMRCDAAKL